MTLRKIGFLRDRAHFASQMRKALPEVAISYEKALSFERRNPMVTLFRKCETIHF
jgi:hypothetical protein